MSGSKKFKGKICVYCRVNQAATADHVFPRELFQKEQRDGLPKVPSCVDCNNDKSKLEHYLAAVLPFGGMHSNSLRALSVDAAKRLVKNRKLHREIQKGVRYKQVPIENGGTEDRMLVGLNHEILHEFIGFTGRGLMWHHWGAYLPLNHKYIAFTPSRLGVEYLLRIFEMSSNCRVDVILGDDTVRYKGIMSEVDAGLSIWAIQLLGGMTVLDENVSHVFKNSFVAMITGPSDIIEDIEGRIST